MNTLSFAVETSANFEPARQATAHAGQPPRPRSKPDQRLGPDMDETRTAKHAIQHQLLTFQRCGTPGATLRYWRHLRITVRPRSDRRILAKSSPRNLACEPSVASVGRPFGFKADTNVRTLAHRSHGLGRCHSKPNQGVPHPSSQSISLTCITGRERTNLR